MEVICLHLITIDSVYAGGEGGLELVPVSENPSSLCALLTPLHCGGQGPWFFLSYLSHVVQLLYKNLLSIGFPGPLDLAFVGGLLCLHLTGISLFLASSVSSLRCIG